MNIRWKNRIIIFLYTMVVIGAIWIFIKHSAFLRPTFDTIDSSPFLASFSGDFIAGLFITILAAFFIPAYLDWRKRPLLEFKNRATRTSICTLTPAQDGNWEGSFQLVIRNNGSTTQKDLYWHLLIPGDLNASVTPLGNQAVAPAGSETLAGLGKIWAHFFGKVTDPVYSRRGLIFPYEIKVKNSTPTPTSYQIHYYFTTEFGTSPARADKFHEIERAMGRNADNAFKSEYLAHLSLEPENIQ